MKIDLGGPVSKLMVYTIVGMLGYETAKAISRDRTARTAFFEVLKKGIDNINREVKDGEKGKENQAES